jgi:hypothetical protein
MPTCFVVLGCTRSGTSVVSGLLHRLGVVMGWELQSEDGNPRYDWPDPTPMNPHGFYQDAPVENAQDAIWGDEYPPVGTRPPAGELTDHFQELIRMRCQRGHDTWGIKASRIQWMLPEFLAACSDDVRFVVTQREQPHSAKSMKEWLPEHGEPRITEWVRRANQQIADVLAEHKAIPRFVVPFNGLFDDTERTLQGLADFVGVPLTDGVRAFVDPSLRRAG